MKQEGFFFKRLFKIILIFGIFGKYCLKIMLNSFGLWVGEKKSRGVSLWRVENVVMWGLTFFLGFLMSFYYTHNIGK